MKAGFTHDLHVHLYGCLTATQVWERGRDVWRQRLPRLEWYADEYERAWGRRPDYAAYWKTPSGFEALRHDFEVKGPCSFPQFQASFNLMIALFPITPYDPTILREVFAAGRQAGLRYAEYRTVAPPAMDPADFPTYFTLLADETLTCEAESAGAFTPRIALGFGREDERVRTGYRALKAWMRDHPDKATAITGLDFCGFEEPHPPSGKQGLFAEIHEDNRRATEHAVAILYHVGESFDGLSLASAIRWVWQSAVFGAHRLGHATALGVDPTLLREKTVHEPAGERLAHIAWLLENRNWLEAGGVTIAERALRREQASLETKDSDHLVPVHYDAGLCDELQRLQNAVASDLGRRGVPLESCPTSNFRIGRIPDAASHPLSRFLTWELPVVIGSDDPGIFDQTLAGEREVCRSQFGLSEERLTNLNTRARSLPAGLLAGRERP